MSTLGSSKNAIFVCLHSLILISAHCGGGGARVKLHSRQRSKRGFGIKMERAEFPSIDSDCPVRVESSQRNCLGSSIDRPYSTRQTPLHRYGGKPRGVSSRCASGHPRCSRHSSVRHRSLQNTQLVRRKYTAEYCRSGYVFVYRCTRVRVCVFLFACSHTLFTPRSYHISTLESFSFTSYASGSFEITATVVVGNCGCNQVPQRCAEKGRVFSQDRGLARLGMRNKDKLYRPAICA